MTRVAYKRKAAMEKKVTMVKKFNSMKHETEEKKYETTDSRKHALYLAPLPFAKLLPRILFHALGEHEEQWLWNPPHKEYNQELQKYVASLLK